MKNIALIGYRGTGKSAVASHVANALGMTCISLDEKIVEEAGMSIPKIVEQFGWDHFRNIEQSVCAQYASMNNTVLDTGGGVILREANVEVLKSNSIVVWLKASVDNIAKRIGEDTNRPSLVEGKTFIEEISEVLQLRVPLYTECADINVSTDSLTPSEVADVILTKIKQ